MQRVLGLPSLYAPKGLCVAHRWPKNAKALYMASTTRGGGACEHRRAHKWAAAAAAAAAAVGQEITVLCLGGTQDADKGEVRLALISLLRIMG